MTQLDLHEKIATVNFTYFFQLLCVISTYSLDDLRMDVSIYVPILSTRARCDTRSISHMYLTGLNSELFFSWTRSHTYSKKPNFSLSPISGQRILRFIPFEEKLYLSEMSCPELELGSPSSFVTTICTTLQVPIYLCMHASGAI